MKTATIIMTDLFTGQEIERTICSSNLMKSGDFCYEMGDKESQKKGIESWINERANSQHDTILELKSWKINNA